MTQVKAELAAAVLRTEIFSSRFETFCNELLGKSEGGVAILPTSRSYDLGRDGRSLGFGPAPLIATCVSLEPNVSAKAKSDVERLFETDFKVDRLYFCSSQVLTEQRRDEIEALLRQLVPPEVQVTSLGTYQLAALATRYESTFLTHYKSSLDELLDTLQGVTRFVAHELSALRLALSTVGHEDSGSLRDALYEASLREVLRDRRKNVAECARDVSHKFRLSRQIPDLVVRRYLGRLTDAGEAAEVDGRYELSSKGRERLRSQESTATEELFGGRNLIRRQIEHELGYRLADSHYNEIWKILAERLTHYFFTRGQEMVTLLGRVLQVRDYEGTPGGGDEPQDIPRSLFFIKEIGNAIAATSGLPDQRKELKTAFGDLFRDPSGEAFDWLVQLAAAFVGLCSLGLEEQSGEALLAALAEMTLVLDTDVVLSLLCEGEPNHEGMEALVRRWRKLGGRVMVAPGVLYETAYHASIAQYDYEQVKTWLPGSPQDRLRLIDNAFVRGFAELVAKRKAQRGHWEAYLSQFGRPDGGVDALRVAGVLREEYGVEFLDPAEGEEEDLAEKVQDHLWAELKSETQLFGRRLEKEMDKASRDAFLYASIVRAIRLETEQGTGRSYFLVSSAGRLVRIEERFRRVGEPYFVMTTASALYLLSLIPHVSLGMGSLRAFLFEGTFRPFVGDVERTLLRVIRESESFDLPWAKRGLLAREFRKRLLSNAKEATGGGSDARRFRRELEEQFVRGEANDRVISSLKESLEALAVEEKLAKENVALRKELTEARKELDRLRRKK